MGVGPASAAFPSRRAALVALAGFARQLLAAEKPWPIPPATWRYLDPATEFPVQRLTEPSHNSRIPNSCHRAVARKAQFLVYASDRAGDWGLYALDLKTGTSQRFERLEQPDPEAVELLPDDRSFLCLDRGRLVRVSVRDGEVRLVYEPRAGWKVVELSLEANGQRVAMVESNGQNWRLALWDWRQRKISVLLESAQPVLQPQLSRDGSRVLFRRDGRLWVLVRGRRPEELPLDPARTGPVYWAPNGQSVLYLHLARDAEELNSIREYFLATRQDRQVAETTQYVHFSPNANASVFTGASGLKASPYVFLLLRVTARELTLCEHRASEPEKTAPLFSPDSRYVFFHSDRHGRWAIYAVDVAAFVERTETSFLPGAGLTVPG